VNSEGKNILPENGEVYYFPEVFNQEQNTDYFRKLHSEIKWRHEPIKIFGKEVMQPRLTAWYGDIDKPYEYSGLTMDANQWTSLLLEIKAVADDYANAISTSALLNLYRDGDDGVGWHRDNEKVLGTVPVIASLTFGTKRKFQFRKYLNKKEIINIDLEPGSILIMKGPTQKHWEHRIPKSKKVDGARINITFRTVI
jgi:alkylated DNA repair dioxygenase AlkB